MKLFIVFCVQFCLFLSFLISNHEADCSKAGPKRSKLSTIYALTPSLRVGRRSENTWESSPDVKRRFGKMMPFPRVGRRGWEANEDLDKRTGSNNGMWFGPRLGRVQKRDTAYDDYNPWNYLILNDRQIHYTPRLGRESEEILYDQDSDGTLENSS